MSLIICPAAPRWPAVLAGAWIAALGACASPPSATGSAGSPSVSAPQLRIGDHWQYRIVDGFRGTEVAKLETEVATVNGGVTTMRVVYTDDRGRVERSEELNNDGSVNAGALWDQETRRFTPALKRLDFPLIEGTTWRQTVDNIHVDSGQAGEILMYGRTQQHKAVTVPAGTFDATYVYRIIQFDDAEFWRTCTTRRDEIWYAPEVKAVVRAVRNGSYHDKGDSTSFTDIRNQYLIYELLSFKPGA
jgi:hypothetical protein